MRVIGAKSEIINYGSVEIVDHYPDSLPSRLRDIIESAFIDTGHEVSSFRYMLMQMFRNPVWKPLVYIGSTKLKSTGLIEHKLVVMIDSIELHFDLDEVLGAEGMSDFCEDPAYCEDNLEEIKSLSEKLLEASQYLESQYNKYSGIKKEAEAP